MKSRIYVILAFIVIACNNQENSISREELVIRQVEVFFASLGKIEKVKNGVTLTAGFYDLDEVINEVNKILCNNGFKPSISDFDLEQLSSQVGRTKKRVIQATSFTMKESLIHGLLCKLAIGAMPISRTSVACT